MTLASSLPPRTCFKVALTTCLTSPGLSFLICKMGMTRAQLSSEGRQEMVRRAERGVGGPPRGAWMGLGHENKKILPSRTGRECSSEFGSELPLPHRSRLPPPSPPPAPVLQPLSWLGPSLLASVDST